jgi:energy-coupling factor transporter ATP-binding protein EcfA2
MVGMHADTCVTFTVYRWNWGSVKGNPIVPDNIQPNVNHKDTIHILEANGNRADDMYLKRMVELTLPTIGIDTKILKTSTLVADAIVKDYFDGNKAAKCYILHGRPGCGKTTTLRLITKLVSGTLFADYNPTGVHAIRTIINQWDSDVVIAYDEFDVSFQHIVAGRHGTDEYSGIIPDAKDKASWNSLLDYIKRKQHVIFVMVTNKTFEEIQDMTNGDNSFLRYGRVDSHFVWPDGDDEVRKIDKKNLVLEHKPYQIEDSARSDSNISSHATRIVKKKWWSVPLKPLWRNV